MFIPHTDNERDEMLREIGFKSIDQLFLDIPQEFRYPNLNLPDGVSEMEAISQIQDMAMANESTKDLACFLGAGAYNHYIPAAVDAIISRGEFLTAYTPYQPEISQGTLQAIFEYQTLISNLTGMEGSNASHYDGATATAEAGILAFHNFREKRKKIIVSPGVNPQYRATLRTYMAGCCDLSITGDELERDPLESWESLTNLIDQDTCLVIVQYPDFFGRIFDYKALAYLVHEAGGLLAVVANPIALGLLQPPGKFGADIVVGEGQPLGIPLSFGGPYLGFFATRMEYIRKISGRLVGETVDAQGRRGYVLTLTAREQHIRREKATSNICSNQGLMALASTVYMSLLGKNGFKQVSELCYQKAHYAAHQINMIKDFKVISDRPFFHEFLIACPSPVEEINLHLLDHGFLGGYDVGIDYKSLDNHMLIAVTEMNTREEIDELCEVLQEISNA
jgi:glycine dehydrogenase subunit 1